MTPNQYNIEIDFYQGGKDAVLILTGMGGSTKGYQNKYVTIANNIVEKYGFSVFVATTPFGSWNHPQENIEYIMSHIYNQLGNGDYKIYTMGHSAGASILLWYSYKFPQIKRILSINPVLDWNPHRACDGINNFKGEQIKVITGEKDPSNLYSMFIKICPQADIICLPNIDHNFTNNLDLFIDLPNKYLF